MWQTNIHSNVDSHIAFIRATLVLGVECPFKTENLLEAAACEGKKMVIMGDSN